MSIRAANTRVQTTVTKSQTTTVQQTSIKQANLNAKILQINQKSTFSANGMSSSSSFSFSATYASIQKPQCGCCQTPPKAGLKKDPAGWPKGTVETRGGYKIVPEGKATWKIFSPDQKPTDKPSSKIWGDPHVYEKDGTKWDFTKDSQFALPDGTRIFADTTSETGRSVSKGLSIRNGNDAVEVRGLNGARPTVGPILHPGDKGSAGVFNRTQPGATQDVFHLKDSKGGKVQWFRERNGNMQGEVTSAFFDKKNNRYEQRVNGNSRMQRPMPPQQRPAMGSNQWATQFAQEIASAFAFAFGGNQMPSFLQGQNMNMQQDMNMSMSMNINMQQSFGGFGSFGGMNRDFGNIFDAFSAIGGLGNQLVTAQSLSMSFQQSNMMF